MLILLVDEITVPELIESLGLPVVVKATNLSGRQGMVLAHSAEQLEQMWTGSRKQCPASRPLRSLRLRMKQHFASREWGFARN